MTLNKALTIGKKYEVNFYDPKTGATTAIDSIEAPDGYTAEDYVEDCRKNADDEWNEMLARGTVYLAEEEANS